MSLNYNTSFNVFNSVKFKMNVILQLKKNTKYKIQIVFTLGR